MGLLASSSVLCGFNFGSGSPTETDVLATASGAEGAIAAGGHLFPGVDLPFLQTMRPDHLLNRS